MQCLQWGQPEGTGARGTGARGGRGRGGHSAESEGRLLAAHGSFPPQLPAALSQPWPVAGRAVVLKLHRGSATSPLGFAQTLISPAPHSDGAATSLAGGLEQSARQGLPGDNRNLVQPGPCPRPQEARPLSPGTCSGAAPTAKRRACPAPWAVTHGVGHHAHGQVVCLSLTLP